MAVLLGFWILGPVVCDLWIFFDVCSCTSSIMHIVVISIDRYLAINDPLNTRNRQQKRNILTLIILIWLIAILLSFPMIVLGIINRNNIFIGRQCIINNKFFVMYGSVVSFVIPLIIVIIVYTLTVYRLKEQIRLCEIQFAQEQLARAADLVAKPFLRRHVPSRNTAATAASSSQWTPTSATALRQLRLGRQPTNLDLNEASVVTTSLQRDKQQQKQVDDRSQSEKEPKVLFRDFAPQKSTKLKTHTKYSCQKSQFDRLKCTDGSQRQQSDTFRESKSCLKCIHCCKTAASPPVHRCCSTKSHLISLPASKVPNQTSYHSAPGRIRRSYVNRLTFTSRTKSSTVRNEQKALKVLGVVFVIFVIAWFPFCIMNLLHGICQRCSVDLNILNSLVWLGYVASTINPVVYTIFNRNFRLKFIDLLCCRGLYSASRHRHFSTYRDHSSTHSSRFQGLLRPDIRHFNRYYEQQELKSRRLTSRQ